jgi:hypothetical protein
MGIFTKLSTKTPIKNSTGDKKRESIIWRLLKIKMDASSQKGAPIGTRRVYEWLK